MRLNQRQSALGIDIGLSRVKLAQFRTRADGMELLAAETLPVPFPTNGNGDAANFVKQLKRVLLKRHFDPHRAVVTLPPDHLDVRPLTLPVDDRDIAKKVRWEAESYLSCDIENAIIDHVVLGEAKSAGERRLEVLAAAAERDKIVAALDLLGRADVITTAVDIVPLALCRLLHLTEETSDGAAVAAVDIGAQTTHAVIMNNHDLRMSRTIDTGGDTFTEAIAAALETSPEEAEVLKCQHGTGRADEGADDGEPGQSDESSKIAHIINDILRDHLAHLASELSRLFRYFSAQNQGRPVGKVLLVGGGGSLKHLAALLQAALQTTIEVSAPLSRLTGRDITLKRGTEGSYAVAAALALREA